MMLYYAFASLFLLAVLHRVGVPFFKWYPAFFACLTAPFYIHIFQDAGLPIALSEYIIMLGLPLLAVFYVVYGIFCIWNRRRPEVVSEEKSFVLNLLLFVPSVLLLFTLKHVLFLPCPTEIDTAYRLIAATEHNAPFLERRSLGNNRYTLITTAIATATFSPEGQKAFLHACDSYIKGLER